MMDWQKLTRSLTAGLLVLLLAFSPITTQPSLAIRKGRAATPESTQATSEASSKLAETAPPELLQELRQDLEKYQPQVKIVSPRSNEVLRDNTVSVQLQVKDLPIFKDKKSELGPHLHVLLDNRTYQAVYDLSQPLVFDNLEPGTHTLRAFASRPWHESFKNEGAYAQTTFHILTKTQENSPDSKLPLLTYSRPQGRYRAEPILLDFYLTNAPLHLVAREDKKDDIADWRIRCTVNGKSFLLDQWQPVYLKGFKPGKNWVQLEFLDEKGNPVPNVFNNTARMIIYEPGGQDSLAKLMRGELSLEEAQSMVDPTYKPAPKPLPIPSPEPIETPVAEPSPVPPAPMVKATPSPEPSISPSPMVSPVPIAPAQPEVKVPPVEASPVPTPAPAAEAPASDRPELETEQLESVPSPEPVESAAKPKVPKPSPQETINNFLNRFRPQARSAKPIPSQPASVPSISPSLQPMIPPEAIGVPESVPVPEKVETPAPVVPKFVAPEKTGENLTTIAPLQPVVEPVPVPSPTPFSTESLPSELITSPIKPDLDSPNVGQDIEEAASSQPAAPSPVPEPAKSEDSQALTEISGTVTAKAAELRSEFLSQFNKFRDRFRRPTPSEVSQPMPKRPESEPAAISPPDVPAEIEAPATLTAPAPAEPVSPTIE